MLVEDVLNVIIDMADWASRRLLSVTSKENYRHVRRRHPWPLHRTPSFLVAFAAQATQAQLADLGVQWIVKDNCFNMSHWMSQAIREGNWALIHFLYKDHSCSIHTDHLYPAIRYHRLDILQWIVERLEEKYRNEGVVVTAFSHALRYGNLEIVQWLCSHDPSLIKTPWISLFHTLEDNEDRLEIAQWLLDRVPSDTRDAERERFFTVAAKHGKLERLKWFADRGHLKEMTDNPLLFLKAILGGHFPVLEWLHSHGVTPIHEHGYCGSLVDIYIYAMGSATYDKMIPWLVDHGYHWPTMTCDRRNLYLLLIAQPAAFQPGVRAWIEARPDEFPLS